METLHDRPEVRAALRALDAEACHPLARLLSPRESVVLRRTLLGSPPTELGVAGSVHGRYPGTGAPDGGRDYQEV